MAGTSKIETDVRSKLNLAAMFPTSKLCKVRFEYSTRKGSTDNQDDQLIFADQLEKEGKFEEIKLTLRKNTTLLLEDLSMRVVIVENKTPMSIKESTKWLREVKALIHDKNKIHSAVLETGLLSEAILQDVRSEHHGLKASCHLSQDKQSLLVTSSDADEVSTIKQFIESRMPESRTGETGQASIQAKHSPSKQEVPIEKVSPYDPGSPNLSSVTNNAGTPCITSEKRPLKAGHQSESSISEGHLPPNINAELSPQVSSEAVSVSAADQGAKSTPQVLTHSQSPASTRGTVELPQVIVKLLRQQRAREDLSAELESNGIEIDNDSIASGTIVVTRGDPDDVSRALQSAFNTLNLPVQVKDDVLQKLLLLQEQFPGPVEYEVDESGCIFRLAYHRKVEATVMAAVSHYVTLDWPEKGELPLAARTDHSHCTLTASRGLLEGTGEETLDRTSVATSCEPQFTSSEESLESRAEPGDLPSVTTPTVKTVRNTADDVEENATARQLDRKEIGDFLLELEALQYLAGENFAEVTLLDENERTMKIRVLSQLQTLLQEDISVRNGEWDEVWKTVRNPSKESKTYIKPLLSEDRVAVFSFDQESLTKVTGEIRAAISKSRPAIGDRSDGPSMPEAGEDGQFRTRSGMEVFVYKTDITKLVVDAIVNAANGRLMHGGGVAAAISRAAGRVLDEEGSEFVDRFGALEVTEVLPTTAGSLPSKMVLHAVGPCWYDYKDKDKCTRDLQMTVFNCLNKAHSLKLNSIAISSISSAIFGVPEELCAEMYMNAVHQFEREYGGKTSLQQIHFVDVRDPMVSTIQETFRRMWNSDTLPVSAQKKSSQHIRRKWGNNSGEDANTEQWGGNSRQETSRGQENKGTQDTSRSWQYDKNSQDTSSSWQYDKNSQDTSSSWQYDRNAQDTSRRTQNKGSQDTSRDTLDTARQSHNKDSRDISEGGYHKDIQDSSKAEYSRNIHSQETGSGHSYDTRDTRQQDHDRDNQGDPSGSSKLEGQRGVSDPNRQNTSQATGCDQGATGRGRSGKGKGRNRGSKSQQGKKDRK